MDGTKPTPVEQDCVDAVEAALDRQRRIAHEAELLTQARASVDAGRLVSEEQVDAWIDSLGTDDELPPPRSGR